MSREVAHYNLQMIIAVGFKVNNERAVQLRKWANGIVKNYTIKGWVIDDERLKNGGSVLTKVRSDCQSEDFIRRSRIYMQHHLTMTVPRRQQNSFLQKYRIRCIMRFTAIRQLN